MAMSKSDFNEALREAVSVEFSNIPTDESSINYTFSERFNKKMEKLLRLRKKVYYNFLNTVSKRVAIICLGVVILFTSVCSVKAIREPIVNVITKAYESFTRYFFEGDTTKTITKEFSIEALPEGFVQTDFESSDMRLTKTFENDAGDILEFSQTITEGTEYNLDAEHGNAEKMIISDHEVYVIMTDEVTQAVWVEDAYLLSLTYYGTISIDNLTVIIEGIK